MNDSNLTRRGVLLAASGAALGAALPAPKCSSASASFPGGLPRSFMVILTVRFAVVVAVVAILSSSEPGCVVPSQPEESHSRALGGSKPGRTAEVRRMSWA